MSHTHTAWLVCRTGAVAAVLFCLAVNAYSDTTQGVQLRAPGHIAFEELDLPAPTLEVSLPQGMIRDLLGLGDAAVAGIAEALLRSVEKNDSLHGTRLAAEQLAAARQILQLASDVVHEARVRVYRHTGDGYLKPEALSRLDEQLRERTWDTAVRVRENNQNVRVSLLRDEGAVRGIFVVVSNEGAELVLLNVACDISQDNVKKLTAAATTIGLDHGLASAIESKLSKLQHTRQHPPEPPPAIPAF